ncbi:MAG: response regulator [Candidatus Gracilibacteria bacterium]|nr:response regulator [Candidatus Gracilibacteria bacterium]MDQ7023790.1 response regulator [Candidatus Gracilibacteria bacterium]
MKILLIEDNLILSRNIVRFFALQDIQVDLSLDGKDGFYKAKNNFYDAIILDISLPEMDGLEICKKLR